MLRFLRKLYLPRAETRLTSYSIARWEMRTSRAVSRTPPIKAATPDRNTRSATVGSQSIAVAAKQVGYLGVNFAQAFGGESAGCFIAQQTEPFVGHGLQAVVDGGIMAEQAGEGDIRRRNRKKDSG